MTGDDTSGRNLAPPGTGQGPSSLATFLARWREPLVLAAATAFFLWLALGTFRTGDTLIALACAAASAIGAALTLIGWQRARLPATGGGPGLLDITERRIAYFAPLGGGIVALPAVTRIEIVTTSGGPAYPDVFWRFHAEGQPPLDIPTAAAGADRLFEALSPFPGIDWEAVLTAMGSTEDRVFTVWERPT